MLTTDIRYRKVSPDGIGRIRCIGTSSTEPCSEWSTWCRQWQTSAMAAPAFRYACDDHAASMARDDGMSLEPNAPGFADSTRERNGTIPSAQLEPELRWTPDVELRLHRNVDTRSHCGGQVADGSLFNTDYWCVYCGAKWSDPNPYAVGSIWHTSWGYDQTNVEFYTVVRETKASVWLVPMGAEVRDGRLWPTGALLWTMRPSDDTNVVSAEMHRKGKHGAYIRMDYVRSAWPYEGGGEYSTHAAGGAGH